MTKPEQYLSLICDFVIPKLDEAQKDVTLSSRLRLPLLDAGVAMRKVQLLIQQNK